MNDTLLNFEKKIGLGPVDASRLLGIAYVTYAQCRSGARSLQKYHARHIEAVLLLPKPALDKLIKEYTNGA